MIVDGSLGTRLKRLRSARRRSLSELSLRSGIGKGTISELENDRRGARSGALFAFTTALDVPFGALLPDEHPPTRSVVQGEPVTAVLLERWPLQERLVEVYRATLTEAPQPSAAPAPGVQETVAVVQGRAQVGLPGRERELGEGRALRYRGDRPNRYQSLDGPAQVVFLMHYPRQQGQERPVQDG